MEENNTENKSTTINITSTAVEKGLDLATNFLDKLIVPAIEETGLLLKDKVTFWRLKNQIKTLNKTQEYCEKHNISLKSISLKLLCPLMENASLEEDEFLQDKWSILLGNMVDSEQNIENHVFPFLLGQISKPEFINLEKTIFLKKERIDKFTTELEEFKVFKVLDIERIKLVIVNLGDLKGNHELLRKKWSLEKELRRLDEKESELLNQIRKDEYLDDTEMAEFELSNLIRLGLIKTIPQHYAYAKGKQFQTESDYVTVEDLEILIDHDEDLYVMTELGEIFIKACQEKQ
jgi:hypothetical protein